jgi:catechol 2,3-dioxygenase-like lactoylglutathione lyase family enzyme
MAPHLRIARPVSDLERSVDMYCHGLGWRVLASFENHAGFDGVMVGDSDGGYHFEFTQCRVHPVKPAPTSEDLAVLYIQDTGDWIVACARMIKVGFTEVEPFNPYWKTRGKTFEDPDGYRFVLQNDAWGGGA